MIELYVVFFMLLSAAAFLGCVLFYYLSNPPSQGDTFPDAW